MRISQLPEGLRQLAEKRREQFPDKFFNPFFSDEVSAINWTNCPEPKGFWWKVCNNNFTVYHGCKVTNFNRKER